VGLITLAQPFDAHCCHMGRAIKHSVPDRVKQSFIFFDNRALWRSALSVSARMSKITHMATVSFFTLSEQIWQILQTLFCLQPPFNILITHLPADLLTT